jgi:hypothetical protein
MESALYSRSVHEIATVEQRLRQWQVTHPPSSPWRSNKIVHHENTDDFMPDDKSRATGTKPFGLILSPVRGIALIARVFRPDSF